jgi:CxxC-x17-CxxC domain-containing protein
MGDFRQRGDKRFGGSHGGGDFGGRDRGTMHQATCAQCGGTCEVPFRPVEGRPVYCDTCFRDIRDRDARKTGNFRGQDRFPQKDFNRKPFAKPEFSGNAGGGSNGELKKQLEMLNSKMDRLIRAVEIMANIKPVAAEAKKEIPAKAESVIISKKISKKAAKKKKK